MSIQIEPKIIFTNEELLVVDKPAGWLTHPASSGGGSATPAITDWLISHYPELKEIGGEERLQNGTTVPRAGILHRLDRETSGVLAVARTPEAFDWFTRAFRDRTVEKVYRAIVVGVVKKEEGLIDLPISRSRKDPRRRVAHPARRGRKSSGDREARTHYQVVERFPQHTYLELKPETGRTHQIRAHLKAIQAPILGDTLYAGANSSSTLIKRTALHACSLTLPLPKGGVQTFESPLPVDFSQALEHLREV